MWGWARDVLHAQHSGRVLHRPGLVAIVVQQAKHLKRVILVTVGQRVRAMVRIDLAVSDRHTR